MQEGNEHMDDSFKKMSEELQASYDKSFWNDVSAKLEDDSLDEAFRNAAANYTIAPDFSSVTEELGDAFMDDAFREAATQQSAVYSNTYWTEMESMVDELQMNDAFHSASKEVKAQYNPVFWGDANVALEKEGLHYEYKSAYWDEVKHLLDKADRRIFFRRWAVAASVLLLMSLFGLNELTGNNLALENSNKSIHADKSLNGSFSGILSEANTPVPQLVNNNDVLAENGFNANPESNDINGVDNNALANNTVEDINNGNSSVEESRTNDIVDNSNSANSNAPNSNNSDSGVDRANDSGNESNLVENGSDNEALDNNSENGSDNNTVAVSSGVNNVTMYPALNNNAYQEELNSDVSLLSPGITRLVNNSGLKEDLNRPMIEIDSYKPGAVHEISLLGHFGLGRNYGLESSEPVTRQSLGLEYNVHGFGFLRKFDFGARLAANRYMLNWLGVDRSEITFVENSLPNGEFSFRQIQKISYQELNYSNLNLFVNYRISPSHKIGVGIGGEYLYAVRTKSAERNFEEYKNRRSEFAKFIPVTDGVWDVMSGINTVDFRVSFGYEYRFSNKTSFQLQGNYGLMDRSDDSFVTETKFDNEVNVMIGFKHTLFRKL